MQAFMSHGSSFLNQFVYLNVFYDFNGVYKSRMVEINAYRRIN